MKKAKMTEVSEKPILFSGPMVRAILSGAKTQTRRVAKLTAGGHVRAGRKRWHPADPDAIFACPYGRPGDHLWVRERQRVVEIQHGRDMTDEGFCNIRVRYEADGSMRWVPYPDRLKGEPVVGKCFAYGGHREASRLTLEIVGVRVERLQEISEEDAIAEGVSPLPLQDRNDPSAWWETAPGENQSRTARGAFRNLWDSLNKSRGFGWDMNPLVWVIEFRRQCAER